MEAVCYSPFTRRSRDNTLISQAWKEGNYTVAEFMSKKITGDHQRLALLPPHVRELLAYKLHHIGKSLLKEPNAQDGTKPADAVEWLQMAFSMADQLDDTTGSGVAELKISLLRTMARAYFVSESYDRAEAVLNELLPTIDASADHASSEYQELRWLRLAVLKRRKAGDPALLDAFKSIIDHMELTEPNITELVFDFHADITLGAHAHIFSALVTNVNLHCLSRALRHRESETDHVDRLVLSLIFHCSKDDDHARAMKSLESTFASLIWQYGGRHYKAKRWSEAAEWYLAGSHQLFRNHGLLSSSKCLRKAALCYIEKREYAHASTIIRRCPTNEATTHYIIFLTAVHQAIRAISDMQKAPDFDRKMLLLATQISHQSEMRTLLLSVLEGLLKTLKMGSSGDVVAQAMTLIRCIVKLILQLLVEPAANKPILIDTVVNHYRTARILTAAASEQRAVSLIFKDVSWLWRTAYNCAVQGCSDWENAGEQISELFDISRQLLEACCNASPVDVDSESRLHLVNASFAAVSGRVFSVREIVSSTGAVDAERLRVITTDIKTAKNRITDILNNAKALDEGEGDRIQYFLHTLRVFETEFLVHLKEWNQISQIVQEIVKSGLLAVDTYEAIADILWVDKDCPVNGKYATLSFLMSTVMAPN
ncbi:hypothetical protein K443DRAFT_106039 [Laccaria amethystina LaAM-08-1]|uniref:Protein ZIP4 homolog n=1 Tax=Laccaria amethystina LaAM-08-1 TaxID=1095629 RepID=A0A0C9XM29_9AGAR|nr:hypothetical protein K443DRAFT_106039 [Laccaria amethystina LaAM-08-1]